MWRWLDNLLHGLDDRSVNVYWNFLLYKYWVRLRNCDGHSHWHLNRHWHVVDDVHFIGDRLPDYCDLVNCLWDFCLSELG